MNSSNAQLGVDFGCIGNHEFDFGVENLEHRLDDSQALWLLSNIVRPGSDNKSVAGTSTHILTRWNGIRVGFIGLVENWLPLCSKLGDGEFEYQVCCKFVGVEMVQNLTITPGYGRNWEEVCHGALGVRGRSGNRCHAQYA